MIAQAPTSTIVPHEEDDDPAPDLSLAQVVSTIQLLLAARRQARCLERLAKPRPERS